MKDFDGDVKVKKSTEQEHDLVVIFIKNSVSMSAESDLAGLATQLLKVL